MLTFFYFYIVNPGLKHVLKKYLKYFKVKDRLSNKHRLQQADLVKNYQLFQEKNELPELKDTGFKLFSQFEEDGLLLYIFSLLNFPNKTFIEFGADDGINSNSANLYYHHDFKGLFMDGNSKALERGRHFFKKHGNKNIGSPVFKECMINAENINELIIDAGFEGEVGLLSIDIDGNDYWVWKAMDKIEAQVVIIETHNEFGLNDIIVPYDSTYFYPGKHPDYHGASPIAMTKLAKHKGYRLVGANELGFNFIYIKNDLLVDELPTVSVESLLQHPSNNDAVERFDAIKDWEYLSEEF